MLNGFIYSLLGLYDLNATVPISLSRDAGHLYEQGMNSLKKMLMLFDTGSGTIYDLRHFTLGTASNIFKRETFSLINVFLQVLNQILPDGTITPLTLINCCYLPKYTKILSYPVRPNGGIVTCMENDRLTTDKLNFVFVLFVFGLFV